MTFGQAVEKLVGMWEGKPRCIEYSYWVHGISDPRGRCRIYVEDTLNATGPTWEQAFAEAERQANPGEALSQSPKGEPKVN